MAFDREGFPVVEDMDADRLVPVHVCWNESEADIVLSFLAAQGIQATTSCRALRTLYPINMNGFGKIQVFVATHDVEAATQLLAERNQAEPSSEDDPDYDGDGAPQNPSG